MANPQLEKGYTRIANEILRELSKHRLSGGEWQILLVVLRKTYGWRKKEDDISLTQFEKETDLTRPSVCSAIKLLVKNRLLLVKRNILVNRYEFNKNYDEWGSKEKRTSKGLRTRDSKGQWTSTSKADWTHKRKIKERIKEKVLLNTCAKALIKKPNEDLEKLLEYAKTLNFPLQGTQQGNRYSAFNLLKKIGFNKSRKAVAYAVKIRGEPYSPTISDFTQLYKKIGDLITFHEKQRKEKDGKRRGVEI